MSCYTELQAYVTQQINNKHAKITRFSKEMFVWRSLNETNWKLRHLDAAAAERSGGEIEK